MLTQCTESYAFNRFYHEAAEEEYLHSRHGELARECHNFLAQDGDLGVFLS